MLLDSPLNFNEHVQSKTNKSYKTMGLIKQLSIHLSINYLEFISHLLGLTSTVAI